MKINDAVRVIAILLLIIVHGIYAVYPGTISENLLVVLSSALAAAAGLATPIPKYLQSNITQPTRRCQYEDICKEREFIEIRKSFDTTTPSDRIDRPQTEKTG